MPHGRAHLHVRHLVYLLLLPQIIPRFRSMSRAGNPTDETNFWHLRCCVAAGVWDKIPCPEFIQNGELMIHFTTVLRRMAFFATINFAVSNLHAQITPDF